MMTQQGLARTAGALYLVLAIAGGFSQLYVRASVSVPMGAGATAANIAQRASLLRFGFAADLVNITLFVLVALVMYALLKPVNEKVALAMVVFNVIAVAIMSTNMLNHLGALLVATEPGYTSGLSPDSAGALAAFLLDMHGHGYLVAQIFFGLWLLPLGYLAYMSGYFPKALGIMLMIGSGGYLVDVVASLLSSEFQSSWSLYFAMPSALAEVLFLLWLLIKGVGAPRPDRQMAVAS